MFAGPIFSREALTAPRQTRHFLIRSGYVAAMFVLTYTAAQATFGWQSVRNVGDIARFGSLLFQIFSIVQVTLMMFFALLFAAGNVAQEKDRQTLILLLMTDLRDPELVLGKLWASFLTVAVLIAASVPIFGVVYLLGGVTLEQIGWSLGVCVAAALAAGSWGTLVAYWREKTFQTLAIGVLGMVLLIGVSQAVSSLSGPGSAIGYAAGLLNPYGALSEILDPLARQSGLDVRPVSALGPVLALLGLSLILNVVTTLRLRIWNPNRSVFIPTKTEEVAGQALTESKHRVIWNNPVIWREVRTRAYGRKMFAIKLAYLAVVGFAVVYLRQAGAESDLVLGMISPLGFAVVGLSLISLMLVNAQGVTALTGERDGQTLELLLMTDVTAGEFIFGKLGGILYNTKELILIPPAIIGYFAFRGTVSLENFLFILIGFLVLVGFASMLGLHSGLSFENSRSAIANSLGTMFFLFIGIFIFMLLLVEARSSFFVQFQSFIVFIGVGSLGLYSSLGHKNPSAALRIASGLLPFLTFYSITEFLLNGTLGVCLWISVAYGFATVAMLIPAVSELDVALGRATLD